MSSNSDCMLNFNEYHFYDIDPVLCILTSKLVLRTPFTGRNRPSDAKTTFSVTNGTKQLYNL